MSDEVPRLRMFAGPNGSGKSTLKTVLPPKLIGVYLNPDEIERDMNAIGGVEQKTRPGPGETRPRGVGRRTLRI